METNTKTARLYEVNRWEFFVLWSEATLFGGALLVLAFLAGPKLARPQVHLPGFVWFGIGATLMGFAFYPALRVQMRNIHERGLPFLSWALGVIAGAVAGSLLYAVLSPG
jgi:hypothetical protein